MNKKVFLEKLRKKLKILNKNELEDIIEEYEDHINEKVASGKTEEEAVKDFGDFEELVKEILSAYKISEDYEETIKEKNVVADFIDTCVSFVKDFAKNIGSRSANDIVKFVVEFIVLILFIAILKLPILLVEEVGEWLFERLISPFGDGLAIIWRYMIEIIYFVLAVAGIVNFVKKRYMEVETVEEKKSIKEENIEKQALEIIKKYYDINNVYITSFMYNALLKIRKLDEFIKIGWLIEEDINENNIKELMNINGNQICPPAKLVSKSGIKLARDNKLSVRLWGISNIEIMKEAYYLDTDGMTVNFPDKLKELIERK